MEYDKYIELYDDLKNTLDGYWYVLQCWQNKCTPNDFEIKQHEEYFKKIMDKYKLV